MSTPSPSFANEHDGDAQPRSRADHSYGYAEALRDGVVRPVLFMAYSGGLVIASDHEQARAVGRLVRARRRVETASVFLPSVEPMLQHAAQLEEQRYHVLGRPIGSDDDLSAAEAELLATATASAPDSDLTCLGFEALQSAAQFDRVVFDSGEFGQHAGSGSPEEEEYLGLPGLLEPDQVATPLNQRQAEQLRVTKRRARAVSGIPSDVPSRYRSIDDLRKEPTGLVAAWHHRTGETRADPLVAARQLWRAGHHFGRRNRSAAADRHPSRVGHLGARVGFGRRSPVWRP